MDIGGLRTRQRLTGLTVIEGYLTRALASFMNLRVNKAYIKEPET